MVGRQELQRSVERGNRQLVGEGLTDGGRREGEVGLGERAGEVDRIVQDGEVSLKDTLPWKVSSGAADAAGAAIAMSAAKPVKMRVRNMPIPCCVFPGADAQLSC